MPGLELFREAVSQLEQTQLHMAKASASNEGDWRSDLIELRRSLQARIRDVATAMDECQLLSSNAELAPLLRDALSKMRSTLALHQANWPAVAIDRSDLAYVQSTAAVRAANRAFISLARRALAEGRGRSADPSSGSKK